MASFQEISATIQEGDFVRALAMLDSVTPASEEERASVLFHRAWCRETLGEPDKWDLVARYEEAASVSGDPILQANALFRAGWVLIGLPDYQRAEPFLARAFSVLAEAGARNAVYCHAGLWQAVCWENEGRYLDAIERYREIAALDQDLRAECLYRLIQCQIVVGSLEEALAMCNEAAAVVAKDPSPRAVELDALIGREQAALRTAMERA